MTTNPFTRRGFTLIEILVVIGLIAIVTGFSSIGNLSAYGEAISGNDAQTVESILRRARISASASTCRSLRCEYGNDQGVRLEAGALSIYEDGGEPKEMYPLSGTHPTSPSTWLFLSGSGDAASSSESILSDGHASWELTVTEFGMIDASRVTE